MIRRFGLLGFGLLALTLLLVTAIGAPWLAPFGPDQMFPRARLSPPGPIHLLGTDQLGRDVFSRVLYGGRISLMIASISVITSFCIGVPIGILAASVKRIDAILMRALDIVFSFPPVLLAILIVSVLGPGTLNAMIAIAITYIPRFARIVRSQALVVVEMDYVTAAQSFGQSFSGIVWRHIAPNVSGLMIVQFSLNFATAIIAESSLSFLGLGVQPPWPSWGGMLDQGRTFVELAPWVSVFPGLAIFLTVFSLNLIGDSVRDLLDPRLRKGLS